MALDRKNMRILILPGLDDSGPTHWQSLWEKNLPNAVRVNQCNWSCPDREIWVRTLTAAIDDAGQDVVIVAHSLGCALVAWWVHQVLPSTLGDRVKAAMLVAPPDVERAGFPAPSFAPMPEMRMPFPTLVIASDDDPWCELTRSQAWAALWGAQFHQTSALGHINAQSGVGQWRQGQQWLVDLITRSEK